MRKLVCAGLTSVTFFGLAVLYAQDGPPKVEPTKEHEWLKQFVGDWEGDFGDAKSTARMLGGLWVVTDVKANFGNTTMAAVMTLGYDPQKKKYVGSWVDSMQTHLWTYEGTVDATGKILTLNTEGPDPSAGGKMTKARDVFEFKNKDQFSLTSQMQGADGGWQQLMTINYKRKK
jgi:hypothetical protein